MSSLHLLIPFTSATGTAESVLSQAKTGQLFSANSVLIVAFTNAIYMNMVMIITISM